MLARIRKSMEEKDQGFTLIELLVVMIIIGILAAIAIPVFLSQRAKARDSAVKSDVSNVGKEIATYYVDGSDALTTVAIDAATGNYVLTFGAAAAPTTVTAGLASDDVTVTDWSGTDDTDWCVALTHPNGSVGTFSYSAAAGLEEGDTCP